MKHFQIPFFRIALSLVLGIVIAIENESFSKAHYFFIGFSALYIMFFLALNAVKKVELKIAFSVLHLLISFFFGICLVQFHNKANAATHISKQSDKIDAYVAKVASEPEYKPKSVKAVLQISKIRQNKTWRLCTGKVIAYFPVGHKIRYGDVFIVNSSPDTLQSPLNPHEFDLKRYYGFKGISHRHFIKEKNYVCIKNEPDNVFIAFSIEVRQKVDAIFQAYISQKRERDIASALILGIKNELDDEIEYAYAATGTMHVLAVSGLHVGIIYALFQFITSFLLRFKYGNFLQYLLVLTLLWTYGLVTGFCPSVLRAVTMLTIMLTSKIILRRANIFNTLFVTSFLLLCYNPYMVMEVGFQLSFLAVLGIAALHEPMYRLFEFRNRAVDMLWGITVMSIAAQLATFPLGMLYFHQFPNLFLLSNLFVIPYATLIMYIGLLFVAMAWCSPVATVLGVLVEKMVWGLNYTILGIEKLPYSLWLGIGISVFETWLIYISIASVCLFFIYKKYYFFVAFSVFVFGMFILNMYKIYKFTHQTKIIIYQVNRGYCIDYIAGRDLLYIADKNTLADRQKMQFHILNNRWANGVKNADKLYIEKLNFGNVAMIGNKILVQVLNPEGIPQGKKITIDYLILSNNSVKNINRILEVFEAEKVIVDGSNSYFWIKRHKDDYGSFHFTALKGAYVEAM